MEPVLQGYIKKDLTRIVVLLAEEEDAAVSEAEDDEADIEPQAGRLDARDGAALPVPGAGLVPGFGVVAHDELVAEVRQEFGSPEHFADLMSVLPPWAAGLPLAVKAASDVRYTK